jgi:hypothetical protein
VIDKCDNKKQSELTTCTAKKSTPNKSILTSSPPCPSIASFYNFFLVMTESRLKMDVNLFMKELCGRWEMIRAC